MQNAIEIQQVWKRYGLPIMPTLRRTLARLRGRPYDETQRDRWALRGIDLNIEKGRTLGVIGHNGAGKSTLLKLLAGVSQPTQGSIRRVGSIFPMIELNAGIHQELTGRENVFLLGAIMGLSRREIQARLPEIEAFCELGDWFNEACWKYSSGMLARLGFGVAMNVDADILLVDEVLAVGDLNFQRKCYARIHELSSQHKTIVLVSHNLRQIERLCDEVVLLEQGQITMRGSASSVTQAYYEQADASSRVRGDVLIESTGEIEVSSVQTRDLAGQPCEVFTTNDGLEIVLDMQVNVEAITPAVGIAFVSADMITVGSIANNNIATEVKAGRRLLRCRIPQVPLNPGVYSLRVKIVDTQTAATLYSAYNIAKVQMLRPAAQEGQIMEQGGFVYLSADWDNAT